MILIGLNGRKRSGKDETFLAIKSVVHDAERIAFADPLKRELARACDVSVPFIEEHKDAFRGGLQWWGTEFRRNLYGEDYWINHAARSLHELEKRGVSVVVFTDCRFPNEAELIKRNGGKIWRVHRDGLPLNDIHPSETALDQYGFDDIILNESLDGLRHNAVTAIKELL